MPSPKYKILRYTTAFTLAQLLALPIVSAQPNGGSKQVHKVNEQAFIIYDPQANFTKSPQVASKASKLVDTLPPALSNTERDQIKSQASNFLQRNAEHYKIKNINDLKLLGVRKDTDARSSAVFQQTINGVPIFGAYIRTLSNAQKSNAVYYSSGHHLDLTNLKIDTTPSISLLDAQTIAIDYLLQQYQLSALKQSFSDPQQRITLLTMFPTTLYVFNESLLKGRASNRITDFKLLYLVEANVSFDVSGVIKVDAKSGEVLGFVDSKQSATKNTISDCAAGCSCPIVISGTTAPAPSANDTYKIYDNFSKAEAYFLAEYGRNGASGFGGIGDGLLTKLDENRGFANYNGCNSAICTIGGAWFSYSPRALNFCTGSASRDVFVHEYFHAFNASNIINTSSGASSVLLNQYESGAINESFADAFGEDFASYYDMSEFDWVFGTNSNLQAKRSLSSPQYYTYMVASTNRTYQYPDRYSSDNFYCPVGVVEDNGGVHWNSTVVSKAIFLASVGTSGLNLPGNKFNGCEMTGIGLYKVTQILYHTLVNASARISNFNELYEAINMGCSLLVNDPANIYNVTDYDCLNFKTAMQAVELNLPTLGQCKPDKYVPTCALNPIYGDCNFDGFKNDRDRILLSTNYNKVAPTGFKLACDLNNDGTVDAADYTSWRDIDGFLPVAVGSPSPSPSPVPFRTPPPPA